MFDPGGELKARTFGKPDQRGSAFERSAPRILGLMSPEYGDHCPSRENQFFAVKRARPASRNANPPGPFFCFYASTETSTTRQRVHLGCVPRRGKFTPHHRIVCIHCRVLKLRYLRKMLPPITIDRQNKSNQVHLLANMMQVLADKMGRKKNSTKRQRVYPLRFPEEKFTRWNTP